MRARQRSKDLEIECGIKASALIFRALAFMMWLEKGQPLPERKI